VELQVYVRVPAGWIAFSINESPLENLNHRNCCIYKMTKNILGSEKNRGSGNPEKIGD
jgi:hypothetical protein